MAIPLLTFNSLEQALVTASLNTLLYSIHPNRIVTRLYANPREFLIIYVAAEIIYISGVQKR